MPTPLQMHAPTTSVLQGARFEAPVVSPDRKQGHQRIAAGQISSEPSLGLEAHASGDGEVRLADRPAPTARCRRAPQFRAIGGPVGRAGLRLATRRLGGTGTCISRTARDSNTP